MRVLRQGLPVDSVNAGRQRRQIDFEHAGIRGVQSAIAFIHPLFDRVVDSDSAEDRFQLSIEPDCHLERRSRDRPADSWLRMDREGVSLALRRRSEEHTSELQSLAYLVCRLLLEKKKKDHLTPAIHTR